MCLFPAAGLSAKDYYSGFTFGAGGSYEIPFGPFSDQIEKGVGGYFFADYGLGFVFPGLIAETGFQYTGWELQNSSDSCFRLFGLRAGALYLYSFNRYFQPYGGLFFQETVLNLDAKRLEEKETAFKPGGSIDAGFMSSFVYGLGLRTGVRYCIMPLSDRVYHTLNFNLSLTFNYDSLVFSKINTNVQETESPDDFYLRGKRAFEKGKTDLAIEMYKKALDIDENHGPAIKALQRIELIISQFNKADKHYQNQNYLEALALFDDIADYTVAEIKAAEIREKLRSWIPSLEREGINSYEKKEYNRCIIIMKKILLIDKNNNIAGIYLPRAKNRKQALEKFSN